MDELLEWFICVEMQNVFGYITIKGQVFFFFPQSERQVLKCFTISQQFNLITNISFHFLRIYTVLIILHLHCLNAIFNKKLSKHMFYLNT